MSGPDGGGPAFPVVRMPIDPDTIMNHPGMSLRDWFAGHALAGLLAYRRTEGTKGERWAEMAYQQADAMLTQRKKGGAA